MSNDFPEMVKDIARAIVVEKPGGYRFRKYGVGEESSLYQSVITEEVCRWARASLVLSRAELLAGIEPGGFPWSLLFGFLHRKSVLPLRSAHSKLQGIDGSSAPVRNLYSQKTLHLEMSGHGEKIGLVDDIASSGETLLRAAELITDKGFVLDSVSVILARDADKLANIEEKLGVKINVMCFDR